MGSAEARLCATRQQIFDLTSLSYDPFKIASGAPGQTELLQINQLEEENLIIDTYPQGINLGDIAKAFPEFEGLGKDAVADLLAYKRDLNNQLIDLYLKDAAQDIAGRYSGVH